MRLSLFLVFLGPTLAACTATEGRYVERAAYEACKSRAGEARGRCIAQERDRARLGLKARNDACQSELDAQADRAAMIDGRRFPDPQSEAFRGC